LLLDKGADTKATDEYGRTAHKLAEIEWHVKVMDLLKRSTVDQNYEKFYQAVESKDLDSIRNMLAHEGISIPQEIEGFEEVIDLIERTTIAQRYEKLCQAVESKDLDRIRSMLAPESISITQEIEGLKEVIDLIEAQHCKQVCQAVESKDLDTIRDMLAQKEISITQALDDQKNTLLSLATEQDWPELKEFLIGFIMNHEPKIRRQ
jgi:replicative DNA helicase